MDHIKLQEENKADEASKKAMQEKLIKYIRDASSIEDLIFLRDAVLAYCNDPIWDKTGRREEIDTVCANLKQQLKAKGNELKEKKLSLLSSMGIKELMLFRTLLMVGDPYLFSEENLQKAYALIRQRGDAWKEEYLTYLRNKKPLSQKDIEQFRSLLMAGERIYFSPDNVAYVLRQLALLEQTLPLVSSNPQETTQHNNNRMTDPSSPQQPQPSPSSSIDQESTDDVNASTHESSTQGTGTPALPTDTGNTNGDVPPSTDEETPPITDPSGPPADTSDPNDTPSNTNDSLLPPPVEPPIILPSNNNATVTPVTDPIPPDLPPDMPPPPPPPEEGTTVVPVTP